MKSQIATLITTAVTQLQQDQQLPSGDLVAVQVERTRDRAHGDFACNIAMMLAKIAKRKPRDLAGQIVAAIPATELIDKVEIAGPGFINFYLSRSAYYQVITDIIEQCERFGYSQIGAGQRVQVEFVSANPTGPLHVGHGRGAAFGASIAALLQAAGFVVQTEYYVNDAGRQMDILASSVWLRYLQRFEQQLPFPANGYRGDYIRAIAAALETEYSDSFVASAADVSVGLPADADQGGDKEAYIDALIARARQLLGTENYTLVYDHAITAILDDIKEDTAEFRVHYDNWFSERSLTSSGAVDAALEQLQAAGHLYQKDGAWWFRSTDFGDEKDRVVRRENGQTTYFASDIAYVKNKFERGFDRIIYVWGADHHGYVARLRAACTALGFDADALDIPLVQFANLYRAGEKVSMSTRSGEFVTLRELREEVGNDAARFFYVTRKHEQHLDFDLDLAKSQSKDNPVFYIQYAHARICSVLAKPEAADFTAQTALKNITQLKNDQELAVLVALSRYPETVETAALNLDAHLLANYLRELATIFHSYYDNRNNKVLSDDKALRDARLVLSQAVRQVIQNGLRLLGVSAPEVM